MARDRITIELSEDLRQYLTEEAEKNQASLGTVIREHLKNWRRINRFLKSGNYVLLNKDTNQEIIILFD